MAWQEILRQAIVDAYGTINGYARYLAGEGATDREVAGKRRPIQKWLSLDRPTVPSPKSVTKLRNDGVLVDPSVFPRDGQARRYTDAELGEMLEDTLTNQEVAIDLLGQLSKNIQAAMELAGKNGDSIRALGKTLGSLTDEIRQGGSTRRPGRRAG